MKLSRTKNTTRNLVFGMLNRIIVIFFPFIIRTLLIRYIGMEYAGLNSLFSSILQVLNLTELGFSGAIVYSMYKPIANDDKDLICALLNFYRKVYFIIGLIILVMGLCLLPFLPHLISGGYPADINLYWLFIIYLFNTCIGYLFYGYKMSLLYAHQRNDVYSNIHSITQMGLYIAQILVLIIYPNYYAFIILMPVFTILNNILISVRVKKMYPEYTCRGKISKETRKDIRKKVFGLFINKLCATSRNAFDSIFISAFLGLYISALYGNYYLIITAILGFISIIVTSMLSGVGNSIQLESREKNYKDMRKFDFLYMWLCGWCAVCMLCLYQPFMNIWMGKKDMFEFPVVILLCIYFYVLKMIDIRSMYSDAAGLWWENRYRAIIESIANLVLNFVFVQIWGIYGIIVATLISLFFVNFIAGSQIVFKHYFKNGKLIEFFGLHGKYIIVTAIVGAITFFVCSFINVEGIIGLVIKGIICLVVPNVLYLLIYFSTREFKNSKQWIIEYIRNIRGTNVKK